jgi:hypothetical protein
MLAQLERQLAEVNALRQRIVDQLRLVTEHLTAGSAAPMAGLDLDEAVRPGSPRRGRPAGSRTVRRRNVSPAVRARLSQLAKARWAKAKKEGKSRLG